MFLHDINYNKFNIAHGDTLTDPKHWDDEPFDAIVSNPPYSTKWEGKSNPILINDPRFSPAGVLAPKSKADFAFIMHSLAWLSPIGAAAIVCYPGVLYRSGAEQKIRKYLVDNNFIDAIIQLPPDLFFGTTIATSIMVLKKNKKDTSILFIDASEEFVRGGNKNKLTEENIQKILNAFINRKDVSYFAKMVAYDTIVENDYNIAVSTYVAQKDDREEVDIKKLNAEIEQIVARQAALRKAINKIVKELEA
jgi:type I restriction enzyme M protein